MNCFGHGNLEVKMITVRGLTRIYDNVINFEAIFSRTKEMFRYARSTSLVRLKKYP